MKTMRNEGDRLTRRALLESSLATVAVTTAVIAAPALAHAGAAESEAESDPVVTPIDSFGFEPGLRLGRWTVVDVLRRASSIALMIVGPEGEPYQLDVLARDPRRPGVADTLRYSVFLVNGGDGSTQSNETQARGALAVGHYLRWAESHYAEMPELMTMTERLRTDPDGNYRLA
jgi:hypothetical protein